MLSDATRKLPDTGRPSQSCRGAARAAERPRSRAFGRSLLPTGSPFGWNARSRALYVQFLTTLLMVVVAIAFVGFDGWPFLLTRPADANALRTTKILAVSALGAWVGLYAWTWLQSSSGRNGFSWLLFATVAAHILTGTAVCYALGPYTAASGLITVAALLLGMVFLRRRYLWLAVVGWLASMIGMHFASKAGLLPFLALFEASSVPSDLAKVAAERAAAAALIYIPLAIVMDHLISVWRQDELSLYEAAQLDSLTGAYTRGFTVAVMERALDRASKDGKSLGVLMVDLDRFKHINDAHGHALGDVVLQQTTRAIQSTLRADDVVGRFGGEEFVVLLPGADLSQALGAAERCRAAIAGMKISGAPSVRVTASVGVAAFPDHGADLDRLLRASDEAMYRAKTNGRNRVEHAVQTKG